MPEKKKSQKRQKRQIFFVKFIIIGAPKAVTHVINKFHLWEFVEVDDWMEAKRTKDPETVTMTVTITLKL